VKVKATRNHLSRQSKKTSRQLALLPALRRRRPAFRGRRVKHEVDQRSDLTPYGGLGLAHQLACRLGVAREIDQRLSLLERHKLYHESDHVLTHALNLVSGATAIEDIRNLQQSAAICCLLGADSIPAPSTAGDFLRRFGAKDLADFQAAIDAVRERSWSQVPRSRKKIASIDMDSTIKEVYGQCKQGAEFSYTKKWSYHPLLISLAEFNEPLRLINRPGNFGSATGTLDQLRQVIPLVKRHFQQIRCRGDSAFCQKDIMQLCQDEGVLFYFSEGSRPDLREKADLLGEKAWKCLVRHPEKRRRKARRKKRRKQRRHRQQIARKREYETLHQVREQVAEFSHRPYGTKQDYRVVVVRQLVETLKGSRALIEQYIYRFIFTNDWRSHPAEVVRINYGRCTQENTIEQLKNGIGGLRMPTGQLLANGAYLLIAELAWCLRSWLSLLALPRDSLGWEWKRFRQAFVYVAARITQSARYAVVRLSRAHRYRNEIVSAARLLDCYAFS
jgi:hypothetical protein